MATDFLLRHIEAFAMQMGALPRQFFIRSFLADSASDGDERLIELPQGSDFVLDKAARILAKQDIAVGQGVDTASGALHGKFKRTYRRNEGVLATVEGNFGREVTLTLDVEISKVAGALPAYRVRLSRRLPTWLDEFEQTLRNELGTIDPAYKDAHHVLGDVILGPGQQLKAAFTGSLLDYSGCAPLKTLGAFKKVYGDGKALPLGVYAFDHDKSLAEPPTLLHIGRFGSKPMEYNGTLIIAPQNSGKTRLIMRWAIAANRAGYNLFIVDVKGNLLPQLRAAGLRGHVHSLSTDSDRAMSDGDGTVFNILDELDPRTRRGRKDIKAICEALLPRFGGEDEKFWPIRVKWLRAIICLRKLHDLFYGTVSDLGDVYEVATTEKSLYDLIMDVRDAEDHQKMVRADLPLPVPTSAYWANELAALIRQDMADLPGGQREQQYSYATMTIHIGTALEPFNRYGSLHPSTSGRSEFHLSDLDSEMQTTIILAAREHDGEDAQTVSAIVLKRLEQILKQRFEVDEPDRPILLLLDETRRIKGFSPGKYITFAREAKAGCVLAYQSIDQIESDKEIAEVLENVGIQIYLRSVTGKTAERLIDLLPTHNRPQFSRTISSGSGFSKSSQISQAEVPCLSKSELYKLPAGAFPALVFIKDHGSGAPFLVDMAEEPIERLTLEMEYG